MSFKYNLYNNAVIFLKKQVFKIQYIIFKYTWIFYDTKIYIYSKSHCSLFFNLIYNNYFNTIYKMTQKRRCYVIFFIWRGFKFFEKKNFLFGWLSFSHYLKIQIVKSLWIICRKHKLFIYSFNLNILKKFQHNLTHFQKPNLYKGKGLFEYIKFKGFVKLKKIKKKQYL